MLTFIKKILPPLLYDWIYYSRFKKYGWSGDYSSWEEAEKDSRGYDASIILEKVKQATLAVKNGRATYERDSVLFEKIQYDWPVLSGLLWIAAQNSGKLCVVDFGGSLGSSYWQNRKFLNSLGYVRWNIIEQPQFIAVGRELIQDDRLKFYTGFAECLKENSPQVVVLSSVLPYLRQPFELLTSIVELGIEFMIIDRIPFVKGEKDRLTVQKVDPRTYPSSYPAWFFSKKKFIDFITYHFDIIEQYDCDLKMNVRSEVKGMILRKKSISAGKR